MACKICDSSRIRVIRNSEIRIGGIGNYTNEAIPIYQCEDCGVIWHDEVLEDIGQYYESREYRDALHNNTDSIESFYKYYDDANLGKFQITGTDIFRDKTVVDVGCAVGSFLDFLKGVAKNIVAIEPSELFRESMEKRGFFTYPYIQDSLLEWREKADVVTSFDVIEHVNDPLSFLQDISNLLRPKGTAIIGTPTDAPIMRRLLGEYYEKQVLFSVQHLWVFSGQSLKYLATRAGFSEIEVRYFQRYGIENLVGWCLEKRPNSSVDGSFISQEVDAVWRSSCSSHGLADYVVLYVKK